MVKDDGLGDSIREFRDRFVGRTLPFMIEHGWDWARGGVIERLMPDGADDGVPFRRVMVHARQLYVFSAWAAVTGDLNLRDHADRIYTYMTERFWDHQEGGWIEKVDLDGAAAGFDKDLYGHAFALFGLGSYRHGLARGEAEIWVERSSEVLERRFARADGAFSDRMTRNFEDLAPDRRSQNPHMHLLEAALCLTAAGSRRHGDLARRLLGLFSRRFHDAENAVVLEHLNPDFRPHVEDGHRVEPGHHFEWAWLLDWARRTFDEPACRDGAGLILERGLSLGWDQEQGGVYDEVDRRGGEVLLSTKRIWPLLELVKALAAFPEVSDRITVTRALNLLLERYLREDGQWTERFNVDWSPADRAMPSSTAYHLSMALAELERVVGANKLA